jgi:GNAT superfamily N-acetyltransferase
MISFDVVSKSYQHNNFLIRKACISDIEGIFYLYKAVGIKEDNIHEKLDSEYKNSFEKTGGIFHILDKKEIYDCILAKDSIAFVAVVEKTIVGVYWGYIIDSVFYSSDILVIPEQQKQGTAKILKYVVIESLLSQGIRTAFIEVYTITGFYRDSIFYSILLPNKPSFLFHKKYFDTQLKSTSIKEFIVCPYKIVVKSSILISEVKTAFSLLKQSIYP